ncbi:murein biosynthesis integral membrane protein MurJ [Iamia majanohamensis]|uniref:Murein biosynthesis integral membrane protein MurJ n=1 Tax=Iamia majanohamensis TaxID=467976 RepID=A0AAE9YI22_9ACTN|nr:murein biosynthesis integral membrane protein MurJ [Iamia majanohamensis]WCO68882.1 murein biosynthesis integral membrane protein MurJ [Iamia majanohamensis]
MSDDDHGPGLLRSQPPLDRHGRPRWDDVLGDVARLGASVAARQRTTALTAANESAAVGETGEVALLTPADLPAVDEAPDDADDGSTGATEAGSGTRGPEPGGADTDEDRPSGGRRLLKDNIVVATGTALSRVTGVARLLAVFGLTGALADDYLLANNTPNIVYELILGGILTATLVPLFTEHLQKRDRAATDAVVSVTLVALAVLTLVGLVVSPALMLLYTQNVDPDVDAAQFRRVGIGLALLFVPQIFFYGVMALGSALLNARRRFFAAAWAPVLNNVIVVGVLVGATLTTEGDLTLAQVDDDRGLLLLLGLGTTAGIVAMALSLLPALWRAGFRLRFRPSLRHPAVRVAAGLSGWTLGYVIANQVAAQTVNWLAVGDESAVRSYQVAFTFFQLPHGLLAVSLMTTFQPDLARAFVRERWDLFHDRLLQGLRLLVAVMVPASVGYLTLATLVVQLGPESSPLGPGGTFNDAIPVARSLAGFAPGLLGFSVYLFILRAFYAVQDTRRPFWINSGENLTNILFAVVLVAPFGLIGLTSAYSVAYLLASALALAVLLRRLPPGFDLGGFVRTLGGCLAAGALMAAAVAGTVVGLSALDPDLLPLWVAAAVPVGGIVYLGAAIALGVADDAGLRRRLPGPLGRRG